MFKYPVYLYNNVHILHIKTSVLYIPQVVDSGYVKTIHTSGMR